MIVRRGPNLLIIFSFSRHLNVAPSQVDSFPIDRTFEIESEGENDEESEDPDEDEESEEPEDEEDEECEDAESDESVINLQKKNMHMQQQNRRSSRFLSSFIIQIQLSFMFFIQMHFKDAGRGGRGRRGGRNSGQ